MSWKYMNSSSVKSSSFLTFKIANTTTIVVNICRVLQPILWWIVFDYSLIKVRDEMVSFRSFSPAVETSRFLLVCGPRRKSPPRRRLSAVQGGGGDLQLDGDREMD